MINRLRAGLSRLGEADADDIVGGLGLFALPFLVLAIGALLDGGL